MRHRFGQERLSDKSAARDTFPKPFAGSVRRVLGQADNNVDTDAVWHGGCGQ
jgi:hypothetical protein